MRGIGPRKDARGPRGAEAAADARASGSVDILIFKSDGLRGIFQARQSSTHFSRRKPQVTYVHFDPLLRTHSKKPRKPSI